MTSRPATTLSLGVAEWLGLGAMAFGSLHILLDFSVGLFPTQGRLSLMVAATLVLTTLIIVWWAVSIAAAASGLGGGLASIAVLALGWTLLTNGSAIVYCLPPCSTAAPLTDVAHLGSIVSGLAAGAGAAWALRQRRLKVEWWLPAGAVLLVFASLVALANAASEPAEQGVVPAVTESLRFGAQLGEPS